MKKRNLFFVIIVVLFISISIFYYKIGIGFGKASVETVKAIENVKSEWEEKGIKPIDSTLGQVKALKNFKIFFEKFSSDSIFQKNRVKYPLTISYIVDIERNEYELKMIDNRNEYQYINFIDDINAMDNQYDKYYIEIETVDYNIIHYKRLGYDNGIHILYKFEQLNDQWYLTKIQDDST